MAKLKRSRAKRLVLDIGTSAIRLCELAQTKTGYQLTKYYQREYIVDPALDEETKHAVRLETLKALLKEAKIRAKRVVFAVSGQSVFTRPRALPPVPEHKVTQIVRYEIQQQIPFPLDQIAIDYQVLNRTETGGYDVLMAAIKVDVVEKRLDIFREVKRRIDIVDVCPLAAYNWVKHSGEFGDQAGCVALIHMGASTTDIVFERDGRFRFNRTLNIGGNDITTAVANAFSISFPEAETMKRERGFAPTGDAQRDSKGVEVIGQVLGRLVTDVTRSFAYFRSQPGGSPVTRVVLTGGGACLRNIVPYLQRELGMDVRIAQPLTGLAVAPGAQEANEHPEQAAVVLGLALRARQSVPIEINLIPPRMQLWARRREQAFYLGLSFVTAVLIMASVIPDRANKNKEVLNYTTLLKKTIAQYDPAVPPKFKPEKDPMTVNSEFQTALDSAKSQITGASGYEGRVKALDEIAKTRMQWLPLLKTINELRPKKGKEKIWFASIASTIIGAENVMAATGSPSNWGDDSQTNMDNEASAGRRDGAGAMAALGGAGMGADTGGGNPQEGPPPPVHNGLTIEGYATSAEGVQAFVDALKRSGVFVENGVYFYDRFLNRVPLERLDSATTLTSAPLGSGMMAGGNAGGSDDDDDREARKGKGSLGRGGMSSMGMPPAMGVGGYSASPNTYASGYSVFSFRVDVQFSGQPINLDQIMGGGGPGLPGLGQMPGLPGLGTSGGKSRMEERKKGG